ncbi:MAG: hypothetical protein ACRC8A_04355 [Microcoleaceae cyanobacterium]
MIIQLTDQDLQKMPTALCNELLKWLQAPQSRIIQRPTLEINPPMPNDSEFIQSSKIEQIDSENSGNHSHVRMSQLFDKGLLTKSTQVRVRLKRDNANHLGYSYVTSGIQISPKGTIIYDGEEFDKSSPLAAKVNGSPVNGWEYIEIKRDGQWICLDELRKIWRSAL